MPAAEGPQQTFRCRSSGQLPLSLCTLASLMVSPDIVDIKPANMEELTEVITAAEFHPLHCNLFVYSSSKGSLRLCDMRAAALCDKHSKRESTGQSGEGWADLGQGTWPGHDRRLSGRGLSVTSERLGMA